MEWNDASTCGSGSDGIGDPESRSFDAITRQSPINQSSFRAKLRDMYEKKRKLTLTMLTLTLTPNHAFGDLPGGVLGGRPILDETHKLTLTPNHIYQDESNSLYS